MTQKSSGFGMALVLVALGALAVFAYDRWHSPPPRKMQPAAEIAPASSAPARDESATGPVIATVYECNGPDGRAFTDKPCANDAKLRQVLEPNNMDASPARVEPEAPQNTSTVNLGIVIPAVKTCAEVNKSIRVYTERLRNPNLSAEWQKEHRQHLRGLYEKQREWDCR
jgi:hypothetical protein